MKTTRKILAVFFAVVMVLVMSIPVFATGTGSITITNATTGTTYSVYKVFDLTYAGTDPSKTIAYTYTKTGASDAFYSALTGAGSPFTLTATTNADVFNVSTSASATDIATWLKTNEDLLGSAADTHQTVAGDNGSVSFTNLDLGYYYVKTNASDTVVTLTSTSPSASIVDKNQKPGKDTGGYKTVVDGSGNNVTTLSAQYGETVTFELKAIATNYDGDTKITEYVAHDRPGAGYSNITVKSVKVDNATLTTTQYSAVLTTVNGITEYTVTIPWTVGLAANGAFIYTNGGTTSANIVIEIEATVTDAADSRTNRGWFTWNGKTDETDGDDVTVSSYTVNINKYDADNNTTKLQGAEFVLKNSENKFYNNTNGVVTWVDAQGNATTVTTNANGAGAFAGLANGTYTVMETKAPDGYILASGGTTVTINSADATADISNTKGSTTPLPETGGIGTVLLITFGMIVVIVTGVFLVTNKRMSKEDI